MARLLHSPHSTLQHPEQIRLDAGGYCRAELHTDTRHRYWIHIFTVDIYTVDIYNIGYLHKGYLHSEYLHSGYLHTVDIYTMDIYKVDIYTVDRYCKDTAELYDLTITGKPILCVLM